MSQLPAPKDPTTAAVEKSIEEAAKLAKEFLNPLLVGGLEQGGGLISDTVAYWRFKNKVNLVLKAKQFLEAKGIEPKALLPKTVLPILEAGSLETDDAMQDKWAALLAHAAGAPQTVSPAYPSILAELSSLDAQLLQFVYERGTSVGTHPIRVSWMEALEAIGLSLPDGYSVPESYDLMSDNPPLATTIHNLVRLKLIETDLIQHVGLNLDILNRTPLTLTPFGFLFVRCCTPP
jgi:hypothetical protein